MKIGLYFGSFNPIHIGHLAIANYLVSFTELDQVWFIVSPQNPFKEQKGLLDDIHRYAIISRAIEDYSFLRVSNIEFSMPRPSYTIDTLVYLHEKYPQYQFSLIMGADNLRNFHKWKNYEQILSEYLIYVYPRLDTDIEICIKHPSIKIVEAPRIEISASFIRQAIKDGKDIQAFLPYKAWKYIDEMNFYK